MDTIRKRSYVKKGQTRGPDLKDILSEICKIKKQKVSDIISDSQHGEHVACRRLYIFVADRLTNAKMQDIGTVVNTGRSNCLHHKRLILEWFQVKEPIFMAEWYNFISKSKIWKEYPLLKQLQSL